MSGNAFRQRGLILLEQNRYLEAEREFRQALALEPEAGDVHALLSAALIGQERWRDAMAEAGYAIGLDPESAIGHRLRGQALLGLDRPGDARASLKQALSSDPEDATTHALIAVSFIQQKRWREASTAAQAGLQLDPEHQDCINQLAVAQTQLGEHVAADAGLGVALSRDPENALTHANLGWSHLRQHRYPEAMRAYREALRLDPTLEHARVGLIESIKGRNPAYALFLRYFLLLSRIRPGMMVAIMVGTVLLRQGMSSLAAAVPALALPIMILFWGLVAFMVTTWVAVPFFNATLLLHPLGRHALSGGERRQSFVLLLMLLCALAAASAWLAGIDEAGLGAVVLTVLAIPLTIALTPELTRGSRMILGAVAVVFFGLGGLFVVDNHRLAEQDRRIGALITAVGFHDIETYSQEQGWTRFNPAQSEEIHAIRQRRPGLMSSFNASMTRLLYAFVAFSWLSGLAIRRKRSAVSR